MFESEQGFKDVLTGAYIRMATPELYGLNTTMKLPEMMAQALDDTICQFDTGRDLSYQ